jgi:hypothetical protein
VAGVPLSVALPLPLSTNVTPLGNAPTSVIAAAGMPTVVTEKNPGDPTVKVVLLPEVIEVPAFTVSVKVCVAGVPALLFAVNPME